MRFAAGIFVGAIIMACVMCYVAYLREREIRAKESVIQELRIQLYECESARDDYWRHIDGQWVEENGDSQLE